MSRTHRALSLTAAVGLTLAIVQASAAAVTIEAFAGEPFGVGRATVSISGAGPMAPLQDERFTVASADDRVLYPVVKEEPVRRIIRRLLEIDRPRNATVYFLFRGVEPLELQAFSPGAQTVRVAPVANAASHARLMNEWWDQYAARWQSLRGDPQFPPVVENFLAANLARRLGRQLPEPQTGLLAMFSKKKVAWDDLMVTESHRLAIDQQLVAGTAPSAGLFEPLPPQMPWVDLPAPTEELQAVAVEPLAGHVPVECFYLRFGTFTNYLWFRDLNKKWQGDLANMIVRRGIDRASGDRIQQQLSLRENALAKILGPQVIADVAIIGLDPYVEQGAAVGILFHARVTPLLARDLTEQRREALTNVPGAVESTVKIGDRDVSLIESPDGAVRSYYVADGDFHLVTTSAHLVRRFLQAGAGDRALAASTGFLGMRQRLAHNRGDAVFAYVPPEFFRELTSPAVWIEAQRRARSQRELRVIQLAQLEAATEGVAANSVDELIAADLLPAGFSQRSDGSSLADGVDTVRGVSGLYKTVADVEVTGATAAEAAAYRRFADRFRQEVGQMPPIGVAVQRVPLADGSGETLAAEVVATPLDGLKLGRLPETLGEPSADRVAPVAGDVIRAEFVLEAPSLPLLGGSDELHHLFLGVRDFRTPLVVDAGHVVPGAPPAELVRMYVGAWPRPGLLRLAAGRQLAEGPDPIPAGPNADGWQAKSDEFLLMSFKPDLVQEVLPQLAMQPAARTAQVWIEVADLTDKQLAGAVNAFGYGRARETSLAACRLMNTLANQLHVPREQCRVVAEQLMDGAFVCSLGGEYELVATPGELPVWTSTAVAPQNQFLLTAPPADFTLPALTWFKGMRGDLRLEPTELSAHVEIDMAKSAVP
jgi:hypothetical protein